MRKKEKKQILSLMNTMKKANQKLFDLLKKNRIDDMMIILADEQEAAISIGNRIEEIEGEDSETVILFEEYCELLWKITQNGSVNQKKKDIEELIALLNKGMVAIDNLCESEHLEVVFLPYNSSMWDCMETVWRAAMNDSDCNVYVIPIPYFDLNADGSIGKMHYEGERFPKYVPITSYQEYDIKQQHPDIIYIHNPYDKYNKVTRVHEDYYSSVLKNYTNMLVYIPYYITDGGMPETHNYLPAYIYADKIILQTEKMIDDIHPDISRDKFLPLGSPKEERIIWMETHKEQVEFPKEWERRAEGKKVIFFNVSISGLLKYRDKMMDKIEELFEMVNSRDDIILLWRPHPLLEVTLTSMCEDLINRYRKLMRWYKKKNIGILDQTPDPGDAVIFSDAYIGEASSSIVDLFRVIDKPRLYITDEKYYQPSTDELKSETTSDVCRIGDGLWFVTCEMQMLCRYDLRNHRLDKIIAVPETTGMSYVYITYYDGKIILVPGLEAALCIYDIEKECFTKKYFVDKYVQNCFGRVVVFQHYLYLSPLYYPAVVRYDMQTDRFEYFEECISNILKNVNTHKPGAPFVWGANSVEEQFFIASAWSNRILEFNMETLSYQIHGLGKETNRYHDMVTEGDYSWFILRNEPKIVRWNRKTNEVLDYEMFPEGFEPGEYPFTNIINFKNELYLIPCQANHICRLDKNTGIISYAGFHLTYKEGMFASEYYKKQQRFFLFAKKISDTEMVAMSMYDNSLLLMNIETKKCEMIPIRINDHIYWNMRKKNSVLTELRESSEMPISKYIECIVQELKMKLYRKGAPQIELNVESHIGENIHQNIKALICDEE